MAFRGQTSTPGALPAAHPSSGPGPGGHPAPGKVLYLASARAAQLASGGSPVALRPSLTDAGLVCLRRGCASHRDEGSPPHPRASRPAPLSSIFLCRGQARPGQMRHGCGAQGGLLADTEAGAHGWQRQRWGHLCRGATAGRCPGLWGG